MKCFYAPETETHDPLFRLTHGKLQRNAEQAERARLLLAGLDALSLSVTVRTTHWPEEGFEHRKIIFRFF